MQRPKSKYISYTGHLYTDHLLSSAGSVLSAVLSPGWGLAFWAWIFRPIVKVKRKAIEVISL